MKILLVKAPYLEMFKVDEENSFPLGLGYIAAVLRDAGHEVALFDPENQGISLAELRVRIRREPPQVLGISCVTSNFPGAVEIAKIAKEERVAHTVLGGIHATALPEEILEEYPNFDTIVVGEGEYTMRELCEALEAGTDLTGIKGVAYREDGKVKRTSPRERIENLDELPLPARDMVPMENYKIKNYLYTGKKSASMITSRGCPNYCVFCGSHIVAGRKFRAHSAERVVAEIEHLIKNYGTEYVLFYDDTFTMDRERVERICNLILERGIRISWFCLARVNTVDEGLLKLMKRAGCSAITFGIESGDQQILKNIKKGITLDRARAALKATKKVGGIKILACFMFGNPGETKETMERTIDFAVELDPDIAHFFILSPFPGSELYEQYKRSEWKEYRYGISTSDGNLSLNSEAYTKEELLAYLVKANRRFYFRPRYILRQLSKTRSLAELASNVSIAAGLCRQLLSLWRKALSKRPSHASSSRSGVVE